MKSTIRCCRGVMSDTVATLLFVTRTVSPRSEGRKHMFDSALDTEQTFGQGQVVNRTRVRRRRLGAGGLLVLALSVSAPAVSAPVTGRPSRGTGAADRYVVQPGDTLWSIALRHAPGNDPRRIVQAIVDANQVDAGTLVPGQVLVVPAGG
ncbi:MAG: LysM peptidoglycan-binding domain-containing protein [Actinobacteria bacterium]|nr:MAG: LysM peptidoglycan-binding domain-containing protein [Actinomycetota bacterium]